jgi:hypothetical protein
MCSAVDTSRRVAVLFLSRIIGLDKMLGNSNPMSVEKRGAYQSTLAYTASPVVVAEAAKIT